MKRRNFVTASLGSACALAGTMAAGKTLGKTTQEAFTLKVTVLKRTLNKEWSKEFRGFEGQKCDQFTDGQEFEVTSPWEPPAGFCPWAWGDIRTFIHKVNDGGMESFLTCCTDGYRPVFFRIERINKKS